MGGRTLPQGVDLEGLEMPAWRMGLAREDREAQTAVGKTMVDPIRRRNEMDHHLVV